MAFKHNAIFRLNPLQTSIPTKGGLIQGPIQGPNLLAPAHTQATCFEAMVDKHIWVDQRRQKTD